MTSLDQLASMLDHFADQFKDDPTTNEGFCRRIVEELRLHEQNPKVIVPLMDRVNNVRYQWLRANWTNSADGWWTHSETPEELDAIIDSQLENDAASILAAARGY